MRTFSRWMPPLPPPPPLGLRGRMVLCALMGGVLAFVIQCPGEAGLFTLIALLTVVLLLIIGSATAGGPDELRLINERKDEDIGTFARAFNRRSDPFDPWVVRATWDALQLYVNLPLRPSDRLVEDFGIAEEEIDWSLFVEVATRSRHTLDDLEANPYFAKYSSSRRNVTVGDFVKLISWQPKSQVDSGLSS